MMITNPRIGSAVQVWYANKHPKAKGPGYAREFMPLHGRIGCVVLRGSGKPRNHVVDIDGQQYIVNCGHLRSITAAD